jgi:hypothetical protein
VTRATPSQEPRLAAKLGLADSTQIRARFALNASSPSVTVARRTMTDCDHVETACHL